MRRIALVILVCTLFAGCASPMRRPPLVISSDERASEVLIHIPQQEILVDRPDLQGGGGLLGALAELGAESSMDQSQQKVLNPIRNSLLDYSFETRLLSALEDAWPESYFKENPETKILRDRKDLNEELAQRNGRNLGELHIRYSFDASLRTLYIEAMMVMGDVGMIRNEKGEPQSKYWSLQAENEKAARSFYYSFFPLKQPGKFRENALQWSANGGQLAREALDVGVREIADLIRRDFATPLPIIDPAPRGIWVDGGAFTKYINGKLVEIRGDRELLANESVLAWTSVKDGR
jgi:hypothetical protein